MIGVPGLHYPSLRSRCSFWELPGQRASTPPTFLSPGSTQSPLHSFHSRGSYLGWLPSIPSHVDWELSEDLVPPTPSVLVHSIAPGTHEWLCHACYASEYVEERAGKPHLYAHTSADPQAEGLGGPCLHIQRRGCCVVPDHELCVGFAPMAPFNLDPLVFWTQSFWLSPSLSHFLRDATRRGPPIQAEPKE